MDMDKRELRERFLTLRRSIAADVRQAADRAICEHVRAMGCWRDAECVALYASDGEEPDVAGLFSVEEGKRFYFPRYRAERREYELVRVKDLGRDLIRAKFGLLEPRMELPAASLDDWGRMLVLTPAVACDRTGVRLGRGGGFYDRMLTGGGEIAVAVIYDCQLTGCLPRESHDRKVDFAVTESEILVF